MIEEARLLNRFLEVTAIPGVSRQERQIIDFLKDFLHGIGFDFQEDDAGARFHGDAGNLICKVPASDGATSRDTFLLAAHVDTILPSCTRPIVEDGIIKSSDERILGADDRVGVAILMEILSLISQRKIACPNLEVVFLVGEEIGLQGSKHLNYSLISAKNGFNLDCSAPVGQVVVKSPGVVDLRIEFVGKPAHSAAAAQKGINAIIMASKALGGLKKSELSEDLVFNIGIINGGEAVNIIPARVVVDGEIRAFDERIIQEQMDLIHSCVTPVVKGVGGSYSVTSSERYPSFSLKDENRLLLLLETAYAHANVEFDPIHYMAGSDANIFNSHGINTVNIGLGYVNNHSRDEYIAVTDLVKGAEIAAGLVKVASTLEC